MVLVRIHAHPRTSAQTSAPNRADFVAGCPGHRAWRPVLPRGRVEGKLSLEPSGDGTAFLGWAPGKIAEEPKRAGQNHIRWRRVPIGLSRTLSLWAQENIRAYRFFLCQHRVSSSSLGIHRHPSKYYLPDMPLLRRLASSSPLLSQRPPPSTHARPASLTAVSLPEPVPLIVYIHRPPPTFRRSTLLTSLYHCSWPL
ncbi:hypothetical protein GY45DRAFT_1094434 [Cubamyces sp. BRFM 1775]|nr:hypothetical protein GY45DRAFT_1094434 [Cubamyces sp. BRFM 1775]